MSLRSIIKAISSYTGEFKFSAVPWAPKVIVPKEEWAPGMWAGSEGAKFRVISINLETREVQLEFISDE